MKTRVAGESFGDNVTDADLDHRQPPVFKGATCKGSYALGTACGDCERCTWERNKLEGNPR
jgi:hypothetical protein